MKSLRRNYRRLEEVGKSGGTVGQPGTPEVNIPVLHASLLTKTAPHWKRLWRILDATQ